MAMEVGQEPTGAAVQRPSPWLTEARGFVRAVQRASAQDRGVRAALRSGLGKGLDDVPRMHRVVAPLLPPSVMNDDDALRAFYTIAALIAAYPHATQPLDEEATASQSSAAATADGPETAEAHEPAATAKQRQELYGDSLGIAFALAVARGPREGIREGGAETRLNQLTRQSTAGLHRHLPAAVRQLCSRNAPPDWARLLVDLRAWPRDRRRTGRRWLQDFYRTRHRSDLDAARQFDDNTPVTEAAT
ncbi:type I-E CRISPR-associated protein Cse2/CasB [Streptomyces sp. NPDC008001]|uniref:type I-E CRISPR-associated protein Cse2/CasB n=1 Tax=Streptomyces sp. NPDC008001 TaxID=3364804 RepID=UPI0036E730C9